MTTIDTESFWRRTLQLVENLDSQSYYQLLGVQPDADADAISGAYYLLVKMIHPDRHARETDEDRRKALVKLYARLGEAFRVLRDPDRRRVYDAELAAGHTRLGRDAEQRQRAQAAAPDPKAPHARMLYEKGLELLAKGDRKGGRAQLSLAAQFEPGSQAIRGALDALDTPEPAPAPGQPADDGDPSGEGPRAPLVTLRCATWDQVVALGARIAGGERIFLRAQHPPPEGVELPVALRLPDRETISLRAIVAEVVAESAAGPGMRLIVDADDDTMDTLETLIARHKPPNTAALHAREAFDTQRYTEAREAFERALSLEPEDRSLRVGYYLSLGYEALAANLRDEARIHFRTAQLLDEGSAEAVEALRAMDRQ